MEPAQDYKGYNMKKLLILLAILCVLAIPTYAETVDLNDAKYTTCNDLGYCQTSADINELPLSKDGKDMVKAITHDTPFDLTSSAGIDNFTVYVNENRDKLFFTGRVVQDTYWLADFGAVIFDPWWNLTGSCNSSTLTYNNGEAMVEESASGFWHGIKFTTNNSQVTLETFTKDGYSTADRIALADSSTKEFLADVAFSGSTATFNYVLTPATTYYLVLTNYSGAEKKGASGIGSYFPIGTVIGVQIDASMYSAAPYSTWNDYTDKIFEIDSMATHINTSCPSIWYVNNLTLNGNATNITMANSTDLNMTGTTNLTGASVLIWLNGTLSANDTNSATNTTSLPSGFWNVTAWFGNVSTNETITYWANLTYTAPAPTTAGYSMCSDNFTLSHYNVFNPQTGENVSYAEQCLNGCDNVTYSCRYPEYIEDAIGFGLVIAFFVGLAIILKWRRY